jgi:hypothetical protein
VTSTKLKQEMALGLAVITLSILTAPGAKAQCGAAARYAGMSAPALKGLQDSAGLDQQGSLGQVGEEKDDSNNTVLGLWKKIYFAGGMLNDVGFGHFNAGGTELVNDVGALDAGNNFCIGAWKTVGVRTYDVVHPFFLFDNSGKKAIAISIEREHITVARDGNMLQGTWTQDNYDLSGKVIPNTHFDGTIVGMRIAPGLPFPFPFPL